MTVFNLSYIIRVMYILWPVAENESVYDVEEFKGLMVSQVVGIPFDIIPIAVILVLHRRNLRAIDVDHNSRETNALTQSVESGKNLGMPQHPSAVGSTLQDRQVSYDMQKLIAARSHSLATSKKSYKSKATSRKSSSNNQESKQSR